MSLSIQKQNALRRGLVIPALPLALNAQRSLDEPHQRALLRYYLEAGAGGLAVGVHTTQFEIRQPQVGLFAPILTLAQEEQQRFADRTGAHALMIAGAIGATAQAVAEAETAAALNYDAILLSLAALPHATNAELIAHCRAVAEVLPLIGFYLQPAVGGRPLDVDFWRAFAAIEGVVAIKIAPFNRYQTLDVIRGVVESGRSHEIALYTGNDDNIVADLLTAYTLPHRDSTTTLRITGGLLGHWAVWTHKAVELLQRIHTATPADYPALLQLGVQITDSNAAFFDAPNNFAGCIVGIHEVLRRQGLLASNWTLNPSEHLTPSQAAAIDRVYRAWPHLNDDAFVAQNLDRWLNT